MTRTTALFTLSLICALPLSAQAQWYFGISGGETKTHRELVANREATITNARGLQTAFDDRDGAWKLYAGMRLNSVLALEVNYADLGSHRMVTTMQGGDPPLPASIAIDRSISGYGVDVVATAPLGSPRFDLFARVGAFATRLEAAAHLDGNIVFTSGDAEERSRTTTRRETVLKWGVGAQWRFTRSFTARIDWERYSAVGKPFAIGGSGTTGEADTDVVSVGALITFR